MFEESLDIDGLLELARSAEVLAEAAEAPEELYQILSGERARTLRERAPVIAVARDEAFCFIYEDNLQLLKELGAQIIEFSPLHDQMVPKEADGLLLYGGYPELYARELSENTSMLADIRAKIAEGLPCMAECGGFMYLHSTMEDMQKQEWQMAGVLEAKAYRTEKLTRFGYVELQENASDQESDTGKLRGHEFHYFDSTDNGESYLARKPLRKRSWNCIHKTDNLLAGFPHLYYYSNPQIAVEFCEKCANFNLQKGDR